MRERWRSLFLDILHDEPSLIGRFRVAVSDPAARARLLDLVANLLEGSTAALFQLYMAPEPVLEGLRDAIAELDRSPPE
jgi:hypothetical protein